MLKIHHHFIFMLKIEWFASLSLLLSFIFIFITYYIIVMITHSINYGSLIRLCIISYINTSSYSIWQSASSLKSTLFNSEESFQWVLPLCTTCSMITVRSNFDYVNGSSSNPGQAACLCTKELYLINKGPKYLMKLLPNPIMVCACLSDQQNCAPRAL